jgi:AcrR family transcriptional regulator
MGTDGGSGMPAPGGDDVRWRERAIERSLRNARARAVSRSDRFISAANELLQETGRTDFTVQEIVERSQMSLRSFYQHFASKDELLLALFEELIRDWVAHLRKDVLCPEDPLEQLRSYVVGMYGAVHTTENAPSRALTIYHLRLAETHPSEFAHALSPQIDLLREILDAGVAAGRVRDDVDVAEISVIMTQTLVATMHMSVLGAHWAGSTVSAEALWAFCLGAVAAPPGSSPRARTAKGSAGTRKSTER